jgi:hypothetical protein
VQNSSAIINDNIHALEQGRDLITLIDDKLYSTPNQPFLKYGAGTHFRHCIDFYNCFLAGIKNGRINYDVRDRDEIVERDRLSALSKIDSVIERFDRLSPADSHREVWVVAEGSYRNDAMLQWSRSSVTRELQFLLSHTVHHYAIIAIIMRLQGIEPGETFGVAPSTLRQWKEAARCAQ